MKKSSWMKARLRLCAATGLAVGLLVTASVTPASAQAANAADLCTPDVMRLCSEFVPDADQIVVCLKIKRRQLSAECLGALSPKARKRRAHHRVLKITLQIRSLGL
jgi:hypothetical protein